jgi:ABC-type transport system involved in cytochrome c biogenesis permease subunit
MVSSDNVNFSFLSWVYLIMSFISVGMFVLEQYYDVQSIRGYYLVLMPFVPFAIWALVMHLVVLGRQLVDPDLGQEQQKEKGKGKGMEKKQN